MDKKALASLIIGAVCIIMAIVFIVISQSYQHVAFSLSIIQLYFTLFLISLVIGIIFIVAGAFLAKKN